MPLPTSWMSSCKVWPENDGRTRAGSKIFWFKPWRGYVCWCFYATDSSRFFVGWTGTSTILLGSRRLFSDRARWCICAWIGHGSLLFLDELFPVRSLFVSRCSFELWQMFDCLIYIFLVRRILFQVTISFVRCDFIFLDVLQVWGSPYNAIWLWAWWARLVAALGISSANFFLGELGFCADLTSAYHFVSCSWLSVRSELGLFLLSRVRVFVRDLACFRS